MLGCAEYLKLDWPRDKHRDKDARLYALLHNHELSDGKTALPGKGEQAASIWNGNISIGRRPP